MFFSVHEETLTGIEQDLCKVSSILSVVCRADELDSDTDSCLTLCQEIIETAREKLTSELILMHIKRAED